MTDANVSGTETIRNFSEEHGRSATTSDLPRFGALYGRSNQFTADIEMLDLLYDCFGLSDESQGLMQDVVLVSIDLERAGDKIREVGTW